jgi:hypothetical protein
MIRLLSLFLAGSLLLPLSLTPFSAHAQEWRQEIQLITTIGFGDPMHLFVDSLASALDRNPDRLVRRSVEDRAAIPYGELRDALYAEGVDLRSASHAFIRYRFELDELGVGIVETVEDIYFIFRLDESVSDLPILHVDTSDPVVSQLLLNRGVSSTLNMAAVTTFRQTMAFPIITDREKTAVVEIGRRPLRDEMTPEQRNLLTLLEKQMSFSPGGYVLSTNYQQLHQREARTPEAFPRAAPEAEGSSATLR